MGKAGKVGKVGKVGKTGRGWCYWLISPLHKAPTFTEWLVQRIVSGERKWWERETKKK